MKTSNLLFPFIFLLCCCNSNRNFNQGVINLENAQEKNIKISTIADSISYIKLETTNKCLIRNIQQIFIDDGLVFVMDNGDRLLVFNHDGKFLNQIGNQGKGPGEYSYISSFSVDTLHDMVYIHEGRRILSYNYKGEYNSFQIATNRSINSFYHNKHFYCYAPEEILCTGSATEYKITVYDSTGKMVNSFLPVVGHEGEFPMFISLGQFYSINHEICLLDPNTNKVYKVNPKCISDKYSFIYGLYQEMGEYSGNKEKHERNKPEDKGRNDKLECKSVFENNNLILIYYQIGSVSNLAYINKKDNSIFNLKTKDDMLGFENDLTGELPISSLIFLENSVVTILQPSDLIENSKKSIYKQINKKMATLSIDDNPIIRVCWLKK
ncbi:MAG: 6-bladed beta-propeller [Bacteroidales bacterium]|nr:6-bladed beta-propeller [Bacteroidales bacterium]